MKWKNILETGGAYQVSNGGKIRRTDSKRVRKFSTNGWGYNIISLLQKTYHVSFLVSNYFIGSRPPGYVINHKDGNKQNDSVKNLEYITPAENYAHAIKRKLTNHKFKRIPEKERIQILSLSNAGVSAWKIRQMFSYHYRTILRTIHGDNSY